MTFLITVFLITWAILFCFFNYYELKRTMLYIKKLTQTHKFCYCRIHDVSISISWNFQDCRVSMQPCCFMFRPVQHRYKTYGLAQVQSSSNSDPPHLLSLFSFVHTLSISSLTICCLQVTWWLYACHVQKLSLRNCNFIT